MDGEEQVAPNHWEGRASGNVVSDSYERAAVPERAGRGGEREGARETGVWPARQECGRRVWRRGWQWRHKRQGPAGDGTEGRVGRAKEERKDIKGIEEKDGREKSRDTTCSEH